jgi:predicted nucleic acid-binding protein
MTKPEPRATPRVVDASAVARWLVDGHGEVGALIARGPSTAPSFIALEVAHAFVRQVRAGRVELPDAIGALRDLLSAEIELVPAEALATSAAAAAIELGLTAYDAAYVALARTYGAVLLTADRRLAAAYDRAELVA